MAILEFFDRSSGLLELLSFLVILGTAFIVWRQIKEMKKSTHADAYKTILDILQNDDVRKARNLVFTDLKDKPYDKWNDDEIFTASKVCQSYDAAGQMVQNKFIEKEMIVDNWGDSLRKSWHILQPLVNHYRKERDFPKLWDDYEWLAKEAINSLGISE